MLSRIEFLFKDHLNIDRNSKPRVKLNNKKLKYIINQKKKGVSSAELAAIYRVSTRCCKRRSGSVQKRRFGIDPLYIYFSSFYHSLLSFWKEFLFLSLIL